MKRVLITGAHLEVCFELAQGYACNGWKVYVCGTQTVALTYLIEQFQDITFIPHDKNCQLRLKQLAPFDLMIFSTPSSAVNSGSQHREQNVVGAGYQHIYHSIDAMKDNFKPGSQLAILHSCDFEADMKNSKDISAALANFVRPIFVELKAKKVFFTLITVDFSQYTPDNKQPAFERTAHIIRKGLIKRKMAIHVPIKWKTSLKALFLLLLFPQQNLVNALEKK
ncbi:MAG: hypothetical protein ACRC9T_08460 [Vibrionaceae bacterium]